MSNWRQNLEKPHPGQTWLQDCRNWRLEKRGPSIIAGREISWEARDFDQAEKKFLRVTDGST